MPPRTVREARPPRTGKTARRAPAVLIDTNVVLDLILDRAPWSNDAARLFTAANQRLLDAWVSAHAISTVHYIVQRERGRQVAAAAIADLLSIVRVVPLDGAAFQRALTLGLADYEDALQVVAALAVLDFAHEDDVVAFDVLAAVEALEHRHGSFDHGHAALAPAQGDALEAVDVLAREPLGDVLLV